MDTNIIKLILIVVLLGLIYTIFSKFRYFNNKENYENIKADGFTVYGATSNAVNYASKLDAYNTELKNSLLIPTYRRDYENAIQTLEEIVGYLMIEVLLSIDTKNMTQQDIIDELNKVNILADAQRNLVNSVLPFLDRQ
jgi:hypothetical protein